MNCRNIGGIHYILHAINLAAILLQKNRLMTY